MGLGCHADYRAALRATTEQRACTGSTPIKRTQGEEEVRQSRWFKRGSPGNSIDEAFLKRLDKFEKF